MNNEDPVAKELKGINATLRKICGEISLVSLLLLLIFLGGCNGCFRITH